MKDPAVLFYIGDWLTSTAEMDADARGWYLNLILHNYDKGTIPNDLEKLAVLANVKFSEFNRFEQVFEQVLKQKFEQVEEGRLTNSNKEKILKSRNDFIDKRSEAGKISYLMKFFAKEFPKEYKKIAVRSFVRDNLDTSIDLKNKEQVKHMFEHMFKQKVELSTEDENESEYKIKEEKGSKVVYPFESENFMHAWGLWITYKKEQHNFKYKGDVSLQAALKSLADDSGGNEETAIAMIHNAIGKSWKGIFKINNTNTSNGKFNNGYDERLERSKQRAREIDELKKAGIFN